ncbi:MAG: hypothetical protein LBN25_04925 [Christensenellaceae bacterium]|nr:hypothetical protein [Christensenellaceae bacterium]
MTIREICEKAKELTNTSFELGTDSQPANSMAALLIKCAKFTVSEITSLYVPLKAKETATFSDSKLQYYALPYAVKEVLKVEIRGTECEFEAFPDFIFCKDAANATASITFLYTISPSSLDTPFNLPPKISIETLAFGALTEYYLRRGETEEGIFFRNRYDFALAKATVSKRSVRLRPNVL